MNDGMSQIWSRLCDQWWQSRPMGTTDLPEDPTTGDGAGGFMADLPLDGESCDRCRAGDVPLARVTLHSGGQLVFCGKCWTVHEDAIRGQAATIRG